MERLFLSQCLPLPSAEAALHEVRTALTHEDTATLTSPELLRAYCRLFENRLTLKTEIFQAIRTVAALGATVVISRDSSFAWQEGDEGIPFLLSRASGTEFDLMSAVYRFFERSAELPVDLIDRMFSGRS